MYTIKLMAWHPEEDKKTQIRKLVGMVTRFSRCEEIAKAESEGREMWKEYFKGAMKQIVILNSEGKESMTANNFESFKPKRDTPF